DDTPVPGVVGISVCGYPAGPGVQFRIAAHIDERDRAEQRTEPHRIAGQHIRDQDPAIRPALGGNAPRPSDTAPDEIGGDGGEIVMRKPFALPAPTLVPRCAALAHTPDI